MIIFSTFICFFKHKNSPLHSIIWILKYLDLHQKSIWFNFSIIIKSNEILIYLLRESFHLINWTIKQIWEFTTFLDDLYIKSTLKMIIKNNTFSYLMIFKDPWIFFLSKILWITFHSSLCCKWHIFYIIFAKIYCIGFTITSPIPNKVFSPKKSIDLYDSPFLS